VIDNVDCTQEDCGEKVVAGLKGSKVDLVLYVSGVVIPEVSPNYRIPRTSWLMVYSNLKSSIGKDR